MGSEGDPSLKPRKLSRGVHKLTLVWMLAGVVFLAAGVYFFATETPIRQIKGPVRTLAAARKVSRHIASVGGFENGATTGGGETRMTDLERAELIYTRNLKRREAAYGSRLEGEYLDKGTVFQHFQPTYPCIGSERVGSWKDGGKWLCDVTSMGPHTVVYSIGSYELTDFEEQLYDLTSAEVHVFDHTLKEEQQARMKANTKFKYHAIGLGGAQADGRLLPLKKIMETLKHNFVDVLKIDCEGCEFSVFPAIFESLKGGNPPFGQIQLEVHQYPGWWDGIRELLALIESQGYRMFQYDVNWECIQCMEVAFIHESVVRPDQRVSN